MNSLDFLVLFVVVQIVVTVSGRGMHPTHRNKRQVRQSTHCDVLRCEDSSMPFESKLDSSIGLDS